MPVYPEFKSKSTIEAEFQSALESYTNLNYFENDSKIGTIIDVLASELARLRDNTQASFENIQISDARGEALDAIAESIGLSRNTETRAETTSNEMNIAFYVDSGVFGDINSGLDITIPAGTRIYTSADENNYGATIVYTVTEDKVLPASSSIGFVSARATGAGSRYNVGANVLTNHDFTSYAAGSGLKVTNNYPILNGSDRESDESLRYKIASYFRSLYTRNSAKVFLEGISVPGVADIKVIDGYYGIGTAGVVVLGINGTSTTDLVRRVQTKLNAIAGPGMALEAIEASRVVVDLAYSVKASTTLSDADKNQYESMVRTRVNAALRGLGIGNTVDLSEIWGIILQVSGKGIRPITVDGKRFTSKYIRSGTASSALGDRQLLESDYYSLAEDEYAELGTLTITYME